MLILLCIKSSLFFCSKSDENIFTDYVFTKDIWKYLEKTRRGKDGEVWLSDAADDMARKNTFLAYEYEGEYFDTGNKEALLKTSIHFAKKEGLL